MIVPVAFVYFDVGYYLHEFTVAVSLDASRSDGDVASLSNRDVIWGAALDHMFSEAGLVHLLFGYGAFGQIASGLDNSYLWLFQSSYANQDHPSLHNTYVQAFVDYGIVGMIFFIGLLLVVLRQLSQKVSKMRGITPDVTVLLVLLYLCVCAITEVILSYYAVDLLSIFLFLNLYVMAQRSVEIRMYTLFESQGDPNHVLKY
jgi:O-antigen ligase